MRATTLGQADPFVTFEISRRGAVLSAPMSRAQPPTHRPPWMVVLAATMLLSGGLTLVGGLLMVRDPRAVARHTVRNHVSQDNLRLVRACWSAAVVGVGEIVVGLLILKPGGSHRLVFSHLDVDAAARHALDPGVHWWSWRVPGLLEAGIVLAMGLAMLVVAIWEFNTTE